jgi:hypothetical protein
MYDLYQPLPLNLTTNSNPLFDMNGASLPQFCIVYVLLDWCFLLKQVNTHIKVGTWLYLFATKLITGVSLYSR